MILRTEIAKQRELAIALYAMAAGANKRAVGQRKNHPYRIQANLAYLAADSVVSTADRLQTLANELTGEI